MRQRKEGSAVRANRYNSPGLHAELPQIEQAPTEGLAMSLEERLP